MSTAPELLAVLKKHLSDLPPSAPPSAVLPLLSLLKHMQYLSSQASLAQSTETARVRGRIDRDGLEESGLSYEKGRLDSEIAGCEAFEYVGLPSVLPLSQELARVWPGTDELSLTPRSVYQNLPLDLPPPTGENHESILEALQAELASLQEFVPPPSLSLLSRESDALKRPFALISRLQAQKKKTVADVEKSKKEIKDGQTRLRAQDESLKEFERVRILLYLPRHSVQVLASGGS